MQVIGEQYIRPDEDTVLQRHALPNHIAILDGTVVAYRRARFDKTMITNVTVFANLGTPHDVYEGPDTGAQTNVLCFHERLRMDEFVIHDLTVSRVQI
jgi:hypothetical protein